MIMDQDGRERYFHGTNIVYKASPFHPETETFNNMHSFSEEDMELLQSMGHSTIRLSMPWYKDMTVTPSSDFLSFSLSLSSLVH
jgi:endoglycosylceramidase